jgi:hypothetical protein
MTRLRPLLLLAITLFAACAQTTTAPAVAPSTLSSLDAAYQHAIYDSSVYQSSNLRRLKPLMADPDGSVLVTSLTSYNPSTPMITTRPDGMWVTIVPEVQALCRAFPPGDLLMQLRELLGLPPDAAPTRFLTVRAKASDIFRPALDADPTTTYPCASTTTPPPADCGNLFPSTTTPYHYQWIATATFNLHKIPGGYPWTHLGYTYNWTPGSDKYGASEYIIRGDTVVPVVANVPYAEYCK